MRIIFMGSPEFAVAPLEQLLLNGHDIVAVYTPPDKPAGRKSLPVATPVKRAALSWGLPVMQEISLKGAEAAEQVARLRPEAIVVAAFGRILPQSVLDIPRYGCLNIHPSLLPKYRGPSPVPSAILAGDSFAGVSVMRLDAGMDTGPVFARSQMPILFHDTTATLTARLFLVGAWMLLGVLAEIPGGKVLAEPQNNETASYTRELSREDGQIDWRMTAVEIWRQVRAYQPWPEAYTVWQGKRLKIIEAVPLPGTEQTLEPGRVVLLPVGSEKPPAFGVGTGSGLLGILKVQIEGKRAMSGGEFLHGQKNFAGTRLE
jgi:methionyl-tRNA formyltransferase